MGFLEKMVSKAIVKKVETAAMYGIVSHMENTRSVDALVNNCTANDNFVVSDKNGNQVMKFNDAFSARDTYVPEMNNREHEILGLLLVMAVEIALHGND